MMQNKIVPLLLLASVGNAFLAPFSNSCRSGPMFSTITDAENEASEVATLSLEEEMNVEREKQKKALLGMLNPQPKVDPVLADPNTKQPVVVSAKSGTYFGSYKGQTARQVKYELQAEASSDKFEGSSQTYYNLLEPVKEEKEDKTAREALLEVARDQFARNLVPIVPPPLRSAMATIGLDVGADVVPMRDLFTSPAVSYAYERGWRDNFRAGGFPGEDEEARMAMDYFAPSMARSMDTRVVVDMSCATGLFTRRFAKSGKYKRVLGCDYSNSMLEEARRRIEADSELTNLKDTRLELVRLDVGQIPMQTDSVDALHAGAAMHCWPDLPAAVSEIHRVLKPGGRYFATTFLSRYFQVLQSADGNAGPSRQAFQYFETTDQLRDLMELGGFSRDKIIVEVIQPACVVIRCEK